LSIFKSIADFFLVFYRLLVNPASVYREFKTGAGPIWQGWLVAGLAFIIGTASLGDWGSGIEDTRRIPAGRREIVEGELLALPSLAAALISVAWISHRVFPKSSWGWPALLLTFSPGVLVAGISLWLWLNLLNRANIVLFPLVLLALGGLNPIFFVFGFPITNVLVYDTALRRQEPERIQHMEDQIWYYVPALIVLAGLAVWQGWLMYLAAREAGTWSQANPTGPLLIYLIEINLPIALITGFALQPLLFFG
jgi:hypothetical protein